MEVKERIAALRAAMERHNIDVYIIPSFDAHQSEYVAEHWRGRAWISGFTGSAGTAVITREQGMLWTDGRYFIQAENQLQGSGMELYRMAMPGVPTLYQWIESNVKSGQTIGFDGKVFSVCDYNNLERISRKNNAKLEMSNDLLDEIWEDRPAMPATEVFMHDVKFAGRSVEEKLETVRNEMNEKGATHYLLSSLDDIAWLFNIRANDVPNNPVSISYALISLDNAALFIEGTKVPESVKAELAKQGVEIKAYEEIDKAVSALKEGDSVFFDPAKTNAYLYCAMDEKVGKVQDMNIVTLLKAVKNEVEIESYENCQVRDGVAMVKFLHWLKESIGKERITEMSASERLEKFRAEGKNFKGVSFYTIAGYKDHAAMMHYSPTEEIQYELKPEGCFLVDSGAQYLDGTTDITRTIVLGPLTEEQKRDFTLVLKGNIDLSMAKFLYGATGSNLDILARKPLWDAGIDYKCGTGHGVGMCLSVHEGPQRFSQSHNATKLEAGMLITVEPGVYKEGKHGIRTENILLVEEAENTEYGGQFMRFRPVTYCPIDLNGVVVEMLTEEERNWLNSYHKMVFEKLSPYLDSELKEFLEKETKEI